jgi:RHS repeat-associated protein
MTDGTGTKQYTYVSVGSLGALQLQQESGPLANSAIASAYDELGRLSSRTVQGAGAETFQYDAIGRLTTHASDLGSFTLAYLGQTGQITGRQLASSTLATSWSYLNNAGDRRLAGIGNVGLTAGQFSTYGYTTTPENFISGITETSDSAAVYPAASTQTATYNTLNQLTNLSGQALTWDAVGNLTSDGQRNYTWDAENRLVGISYPSQPGKQTTFTYDGLGRRTAIASTPAGGGSTLTTSYLWCGSDICQARNAGNAAIRGYYDEGEFVPGTPAQTLYYGIDQIGSVRRVFASTSSAPAYGYDPYGLPLQVTAPLTDFVYGGMFYNADSGLYLTQYRAYDPVAGRWLSRDPAAEDADPAANLYAYVGGQPVSLVDPTGESPLAIAGFAAGFTVSVAIQLNQNGGNWSCVDLWAAAGWGLAGATGGGVISKIFQRAFAALAARAAARAAMAEGMMASNAATAPKLAQALRAQSAASRFTKSGTLTPETIASSRQIIPASKIRNPEVPPGFAKYSTPTLQSPSGNFQVHFYRNPATNQQFYDVDYKVIFQRGIGQ